MCETLPIDGPSESMDAMNTRLSRLASLAWLALYAAGCGAPRGERPTALHLEFESDPESAGLEGVAHGYPALRTVAGEALADGEFTQWLDGDRLHVRMRFDFNASHWIEQRFVLRQEPLVQETWSWVEMRDGAVQRRFELDFLSGNTSAEKLEEGELRRWSEHMDLEPGRAFAGAAWTFAIKSVRSRLIEGETIPFETVGFTPKPRAATVELSHAGVDRLPMSGRTLVGDRFRLHPRIPWIAKAFVDVPDSWIWLASSPPPAFLRWEGPLAEPEDPLVRVDLLPGEPSETASPASDRD